MKFRFEYRTSDNAQHVGVVAARNRDAVFTLLAKRHIRPIRVEELPDPLKWLKLLSAVVLCASVVGGIVWYVFDRASIVEAETRKQLYGDPVLIENGVAGDWATTLKSPIDRYLARYAQPGWKVRVRADESERAAVARQLQSGEMERLRYAKDDLAEHRQLKRMVVCLRDEAKEFVDAGGSAEEYLKLLDVRQQKEHEMHAQVLEKFRAAIGKAPQERVYELWMSSNRRLRSMGLKAIAVPDALGELQ